ncbi:MAG: DUF4397 domain-containing protein [Ignavibacteria bacterium]|nr:DUF4397 domain-containing protein [Ignavibacteria bacterium]
MQLRHQIRVWLAVFIVGMGLLGCASEDMSIVDPAPGSRRIVTRFFNVITDGASRKLILEQGFESGDVPSLAFSDTVRSPGDSSYITITSNGTQEYKSPQRVRFIQNSVYSIYAVPERGKPDVFDTILITNANAALTTLPLAQVRVINLIPDTGRVFDVRLGCPNGSALFPTAISFRQASVYREVLPGLAVFSIVDAAQGTTKVVGTFECELGERRAYSILIYRNASSDEPRFTVIEETDLSRNAERPFPKILNRTAEVRVANLSSNPLDASLPVSKVQLAQGLGPFQLSAYTTVTACEQQRADVIEASFAGGSISNDSTSIDVRGKFTLYAADSAGRAALVIAPNYQRPFGSSGKAAVRIVHAAPSFGPVTITTGARTSQNAPNGYSSGATLARNIAFDRVSAALALDPGQVPLTVTTASTPTVVLRVADASLRADASYDLVVCERNGALDLVLVEQQDPTSPLSFLDEASLVTLVHGVADQVRASVNLGNVLSGGRLFYGNSITSALSPSYPNCSVEGVSATLGVKLGLRTLAIYSDVGGSPQVLQFTNLPLTPQTGYTKRRVINATRDVASISVSIDSIPDVPGDGEHLAVGVQAGTSSDVLISQQDRRGTFFFYDATTLAKVYTLPVQLATLGNNFSLIVVGNKERGYEVIVSQEF